MRPHKPPVSTPTQISSIQRWINILNSQFPLIGNWLCDISMEKLGNACRAGEKSAALGLANTAVIHPDPLIRLRCMAILAETITTQSIDGVWESWSIHQNQVLEGFLVQNNLPATSTPRLRTLSLLKLGKTTELAKMGPEIIDPLLEFITTSEFQSASQLVLSNLKKQTTIDALCAQWVELRSQQISEIIDHRYTPKQPARVCVLTALKFSNFKEILNGDPEIVLPLIDALRDSDPEIQKNASYGIRNIQNQKAINELCRIWSEDRSPVLEEVILDADYHPSSPRKLKLLIALLENKNKLVQMANPEDLEWLLTCSVDPNRGISSNASKNLRQLLKKETQSQLCLLSIETSNPRIRVICREAKYLPEKADERARYLFFDEQWNDYSLTDMNHAFMKAYYLTASSEERRKISRHIQISGQTDLLDILKTKITIQDQIETTVEEQQYLSSLLISSKAWKSLWEMAQNSYPAIAAQIIKTLSNQTWRPEETVERDLFKSLLELVDRSLLFDKNSLKINLPSALPQADLQIHGTVNSTAFSQENSILAIGTNEKKIALWNFNRGQMENIISGFNHSLSSMAFSSKGNLIAGEKCIGNQKCGIYLWKQNELSLIGFHEASITSVIPFAENQLLTSGRDFNINQWDTAQYRRLSTIQCPDWPRSLSFMETRQQAIGLDSKITLINLAEEKVTRRYQVSTNTNKGIHRSIIQCALISPLDDRIYIGQHNGQIISIDGLMSKPRITNTLVTKFPNRVVSIKQIPNQPYCIACAASGELQLIHQNNLTSVRPIPCPASRLTSLTISPDGKYFATGYQKNRLILWDLEILDIPEIMNQPIAFNHANRINLLNKFSFDQRLPEDIRNSLQFLLLLLQHRFRYDIDIAPMMGIEPGLFDIVIAD